MRRPKLIKSKKKRGYYNRQKRNSDDHKKYFENLYSNKLEIQKESEKFLNTYDPPKIEQRGQKQTDV
jgi:hypothetical protein